MPEKIKLRTLSTDTYPWCCYIGIDNHTKSLQVVIDEIEWDTDKPIRARYADRHVSMAEALKDPRLAEDAQLAYDALRRVSLVLLQDHADEIRAQEPTPEEEEPNVK